MMVMMMMQQQQQPRVFSNALHNVILRVSATTAVILTNTTKYLDHTIDGSFILMRPRRPHDDACAFCPFRRFCTTAPPPPPPPTAAALGICTVQSTKRYVRHVWPVGRLVHLSSQQRPRVEHNCASEASVKPVWCLLCPGGAVSYTHTKAQRKVQS